MGAPPSTPELLPGDADRCPRGGCQGASAPAGKDSETIPGSFYLTVLRRNPAASGGGVFVGLNSFIMLDSQCKRIHICT